MSSIIFRRFKSKGPEFIGQKLASEKSRGTDKTLKRHITVTHNKKYHSGIRGIYITNTSTTMVFANEKKRFTTITVPRLLLPFP